MKGAGPTVLSPRGHTVMQLKPGFHPPSKTRDIGMYLFLAGLFMLFASGLLAYLIIRLKQTDKMPLRSLQIPNLFWASTAIVLAASFTIHRALANLRRERQPAFRTWLAATLALAIVFLIIQAPPMIRLLQEQRELAAHVSVAFYALVFVLILLHAMHVVGGVIALSLTLAHARQGMYDHEHFQPVRHAALYWHFLDLVWLAMFLTFLLLG